MYMCSGSRGNNLIVVMLPVHNHRLPYPDSLHDNLTISRNALDTMYFVSMMVHLDSKALPYAWSSRVVSCMRVPAAQVEFSI